MIRPRTLARRLAMQYIFMCDLAGSDKAPYIDEFLSQHTEDDDVTQFSRFLITTFYSDAEEIDKIIVTAAVNWELGRIAAVERNILRLACVELKCAESPFKVVINEAVAMAKKFGNKESGGFVNGVLDRIRKDICVGDGDE